MRQIRIFAILTLLSLAAAAQEELPLELLEVEVVRRYTVEVIVFSYEENVSLGSEIFVPDPPPIEEDLLLDIEATESESQVANELPVDDELTAGEVDDESPARELELELLTEDELTLGKIARQFELLDVYETIMHVGWTQPTYPQEETLPVALRILGDPPEGLDGSFTLYLSRYLHLVVDLALDAPDSNDESFPVDQPIYSDAPVRSFGDSRRQNEDAFGQLTQPVRFRIQENRIVKNGELRYFDHPKFGVLAKITRVEEKDEDEDDESAENITEALVGDSG